MLETPKLHPLSPFILVAAGLLGQDPEAVPPEEPVYLNSAEVFPEDICRVAKEDAQKLFRKEATGVNSFVKIRNVNWKPGQPNIVIKCDK